MGKKQTFFPLPLHFHFSLPFVSSILSFPLPSIQSYIVAIAADNLPLTLEEASNKTSKTWPPRDDKREQHLFLSRLSSIIQFNHHSSYFSPWTRLSQNKKAPLSFTHSPQRELPAEPSALHIIIIWPETRTPKKRHITSHCITLQHRSSLPYHNTTTCAYAHTSHPIATGHDYNDRNDIIPDSTRKTIELDSNNTTPLHQKALATRSYLESF